MSERRLKLGADTAKYRKELVSLNEFTRRTLGKTKISLFDKDTTDFLNGAAAKEIDNLTRRTGRLQKKMAEYAQKAKESANDTAKELRYKEGMVRLASRMISLEKQRAGLASPEKKGGFVSGVGKALTKAPLVSNVAGIAGSGMGLMGGIGLGLGGLALAGGLFGASRLSAGYDKYTQGLGSRIKMHGRGMHDTDMSGANRAGFSRLGMDEEAVRQSRLQSVDIFGREGSTQAAVMQRGKFAQNYGMDLDQLQGLGSGMRAQVGTKNASRDMMKLQASLIASDIDDAIGPYLETAASMLTDIRAESSVNSGEVLELMSTMTRQSKNSPEYVANQISGFHHSVQNSSGENNAFFQTAFARNNIGGHSVGGTQAAIRSGGIFGVNPDDLNGMSADSKNALEALHITGKGTGMKERIGSILDLAKQQFGGGKSPESKLALARFMMPKFGAKNEVESMRTMDMFEDARKSGDPGKMKKIERSLREGSESTEDKMLKNLEKIAKSQEGQITALQTLREIQLETMGKQVAPAAMAMSKALLHIDEVVLGIYNGLARFIPGMDTEETKMTKAMNGEMPISPSQLDTIQSEGRGGVIKAGKELTMKSLNLEGEISSLKQNPSGDRWANAARAHTLEDQLRMMNANLEKILGVNKRQAHATEQTAEASKKTSKAVAKPKVALPAGGGKTR